MGLFSFLSGNSRAEKRAALISEANAYMSKVKLSRALVPVSSALLLKSGESAYLETNTALRETRQIREYKGSGGSVRIMKGISIGGGTGRSESHAEWRIVDEGRLTLTNKKLVFDGKMGDRAIPLDKIISVNPTLETIEVSSESRSKSMVFPVPNPFIWAALIHILSKVDDPQKIEAELNFTFK